MGNLNRIIERVKVMYFQNTQKLKKQINKHQIISFDIFDTLLVRPYIEPINLFDHIEQVFQIRGFSKERQRAEVRARENSSNEEISLNEIYCNIHSKYKSLKQRELEFEKQMLQTNPQILKIFEYAKIMGKTIIITSDMYLPKQFLESILKEKGIFGWNNFYLSSELNKTKRSGNLYKHILDELNVKPNKILHIGDNKHSDEKMAQKNGIKTFLVPKNFKILIKEQPAYQNYYTANKKLSRSIILSMIAYNHVNCKNSSYWYNLGWNYGGPSILAYIQWIEKQAQQDNLSHLFFIARDGYILKKVFDKIATYQCSTTYLFAPRFVKNDETIFSEYKKYLNSLNLPQGKTAIVDSKTTNFSSQTLLNIALNKNLLGYYWCIKPKEIISEINPNFLREFRDKKNPFLKEWGLMELFMTAPHPPVANFKNGNIIFESLSKHEKNRIKIYTQIERGILDYIDTYINIFKTQKLFLNENDLCELINILPLYPTHADSKYLSKIKHASDIYNKEFEPLMTTWNKTKVALGPVVLFKSKIKKNRKKYYLFGIHIYTRNLK